MMEYYVGNEWFPYSLVFVTGTGRSGKSLFSRLMSTAENVEWLFEPYSVFMPAVLASIGKLDVKFAIGVMRDACRELIHDRVLLRNANFRPRDVSSIYRCKDSETIFQRLVGMDTHEDVDAYISQKKVSIILDIPKTSLPMDVIKKAFPTAKFVHIVRNGFNVAGAIERKGWYSLEYLNQRKVYGIAYRKYVYSDGKTQFIPDWLPYEKEREFVSATNYGRAIMYWNSQIQAIEDNRGFIDAEVKYENMVADPKSVLAQGEALFHAKWTNKTKAVMADFNTNESVGEIRALENLSEKEKNLFHVHMRRYGYEN